MNCINYQNNSILNLFSSHATYIWLHTLIISNMYYASLCCVFESLRNEALAKPLVQVHKVSSYVSREPLHYHASTSMLARAKGVTTRMHTARDYVIRSVEQYHVCHTVASVCILYQQFWHAEPRS